MPEETARCGKCGDTGVVGKVENGTVNVPCDCPAGEKVANDQGFGMGRIFAITTVVGFLLALVGYSAPLWVLQAFTAIQLFLCTWIIVAHGIDKPQTLSAVITLTALFLMLLLGPMWLAHFLFK